MSAPSPYRTPTRATVRVRRLGPERRSQDPVNLLGRSLDRVCLEATDELEIAAHLEALGFDAERVREDYGIADTFALARQLYRRVPRRRPTPSPARGPAADPLRWLLTVAALLFSAGAGALSESYARPVVLWLLVWSQLAAVLLQRARVGLPERGQRGVIPLVVLAGLAGLGVSFAVVPFGPSTALIALTWLAVAPSLWSERPARGLLVVLVVAAGTAAAELTGASLLWVVGVALALPVPLLPEVRRRIGPEVLSWSVRQGAAMLPAAAYGLGQGLLLLQLVTSAYALWGLALFAALLLVSEPVLHALLAHMRANLKLGGAVRTYARRVAVLVLAYAGFYAVVPLALTALWGWGGVGAWPPDLLAFALFGMSLTLALVALALGQPAQPGALFLAGGLLAWAGIPLLVVLVVLVLALLITLLALTRNVPRYAVYLL